MSTPAARAFEVIVVADRCKECGLCIHVCPKKVLETGSRTNRRGYRVTVPARPRDCIGCKLCELACPEFAIHVRRAGDGTPRGIIVWGPDEIQTIQ